MGNQVMTSLVKAVRPALAFAAAVCAAFPAKAELVLDKGEETKTYAASSGSLTLSGQNHYKLSGTASNYQITLSKDMTLELHGVSLTCTTASACPLKIGGAYNVTLKLFGSNAITASAEKMAGIYVPSGATLTIEEGEGGATLDVKATGTRCTAIGGWYGGDGTPGTITVNSGIISASSGTYSAGIGGYDKAGGVIVVNGGTIVAKGGLYGAGIGGGNADGGTVTISGGTVKATGSTTGAGIGGGNKGAGGTVTIRGGAVTATGGGSGTSGGGAGIGGGYKGAGGVINIYGGAVTAKSTTRGAGIGGGNGGAGGTVKIYGGTVTATGGERGAGIGGGNSGAGGAFYNYGGTVWATAGRADSSYESDIGKGASGSTGTFCADGGSTSPTNGKIDATAKNSAGTNVYRVIAIGLTPGQKYTFAGLDDNLSYSYGQDTIVADSAGQVHLMLPFGVHVFTCREGDKTYQYTTAARTTAQTLAPVEIAPPKRPRGLTIIVRGE